MLEVLFRPSTSPAMLSSLCRPWGRCHTATVTASLDVKQQLFDRNLMILPWIFHELAHIAHGKGNFRSRVSQVAQTMDGSVWHQPLPWCSPLIA